MPLDALPMTYYVYSQVTKLELVYGTVINFLLLFLLLHSVLDLLHFSPVDCWLWCFYLVLVVQSCHVMKQSWLWTLFIL